MLNYCQLYLLEHISMKFQVNSNIFFEEDLFEFDICKMLANLFTFQCTVKCRYNAVFGVQEIYRVIAVTAL